MTERFHILFRLWHMPAKRSEERKIKEADLCSPLGALMVCVNLNDNDVQNEAPGVVWDTSAADTGKPWTEGHALTMLYYSGLNPTDLVTFETWGFAKQATWRWVMSRLTNAFALQTPQIVTPGWYSSLPAGLDMPM